MTPEQDIQSGFVGVDDLASEGEEEEQVSKFKKFRTPLLLILAVLLVAGAIGFFYGLPKYRAAQAAITKLAETQATKVAKDQELARVIAENAQPRVLTEEEARVSKLLPTEPDVPNLIRLLDQISYLDDASSADDTYLRTFSIGEPSTSGVVRSLQIAGAFSSSRFSLIDLLKKFENSTERIFTIPSISINLARRESSGETPSLFSSPTSDTQYQILLAKRQSFLLTDEEAVQLAQLQTQLEEEYRALLARRTRSENDELRLQSLKNELDLLQQEVQYSLTILTYVDGAPAGDTAK